MKLFVKLVFLCFLNVISAAEENHCNKDGCPESLTCHRILLKPRKKTTINLVSIQDVEDEGNQIWMKNVVPKIFFVESSGRDHLTQRQSCAVESAIKNSGIHVIVIAMTSKVLNFGENNATCQLFTQFSSGKNESMIFFRHVDVDSLLRGTPLETNHISGHLGENKDKIIGICNYSDVIRLTLLLQYGGWYSDLDIIFLKNLTRLQNVVGIDDKKNDTGLSNAIFHCNANCIFLRTAVELHLQEFSSDNWASGGSKLFTKAMEKICQLEQNQQDLNQNKCQGMEALQQNKFYPIPWYEAPRLWTELKTGQDWDTFLEDSYTVHFYQSSWRIDEEVQRPEFYKDNVFPAYLPLAIKHCPLSYYSDDTF